MHVAEARRRLQSQVPWLCDTMDPTTFATRSARHQTPSSSSILDGKVLVARVWSEPDAAARKTWNELVGPVADPTREVKDLDMERIPRA